jgi:hypothetical protein
MLLVSVCALAVILALINLGSRLPSIMEANTAANTDALVLAVSTQRPSIFLVWVAELLLAALGFVCARSRPLVAIPFVALAIFWNLDLTHGFRPVHGHLIGTSAERAYTLQVMLATAIALLVTGQGIRLWMVRQNKKAGQTPPAPESPRHR